MCGRYSFGNPARIATLPLGAPLPAYPARFNIAPSQTVPLVLHDRDGRRAQLARWGLVPFWADDPSISNRLANARGDTAATKPAFRAAFKTRRGLLPLDAYYEWQALPGSKVKQPWAIGLPDQAPFAVAALWERWMPKDQPEAEPLVTCCIVTTEPNATMAPIHDRMPVIVAPEDYDQWLDPAAPDAAQALIRPWSGPMEAWKVSTYVNAPRNEGPECWRPVDGSLATPAPVSATDEQPRLL